MGVWYWWPVDAPHHPGIAVDASAAGAGDAAAVVV